MFIEVYIFNTVDPLISFSMQITYNPPLNPLISITYVLKKTWINQSDNQKLYIEKGQITQLPKEKKKTKGDVNIYKTL